MGEYIKHSCLKTLNLTIDSGMHLGKTRLSFEELYLFSQRTAVGGKELILSLEDSHLETMELFMYYSTVEVSMWMLYRNICKSCKISELCKA